MENIENSINNQKIIDDSIKNTNSLIQKSVLEKQKHVEMEILKQKDKEEQDKIKIKLE